LLLLIATISNAQSAKDSLRGVWNNQNEHDTIRLCALNDVAWEFLYKDSDSMLFYGNQVVKNGIELNQVYWSAKGYNTVAVAYYLEGEFKDALDNYELARVFYDSIGDKPGIAAAISNMGNVYSDVGEYPKALEHYLTSLKIEQELNIEDDIARSFGNIAILHYEMGNYEEALEFHNQSAAAFLAMDDAFNYSRVLNNKGTVFEKQGKLDDAILMYETSLRMRDSLGMIRSMASNYHNLGVVYVQKKEYEKAEEYFFKSLAIEKEQKNQFEVVNSWNTIGKLYVEQGKYQPAIELCLKGLAEAKVIETLSMEKTACECLYAGYKGLGQNGTALAYHERFMALKDSVVNEEKDRSMMKQGFQFKYEMKTFQDSIVEAERRIKEQEKQALLDDKEQFKQTALWIGLGILSAFFLFILNRYQASNKQKKIIKSQKKEVDIAYDQLEEQNKEILDSIQYAKRIQTAILPPKKLVKEYLADSFILYKPKDIVAGDFYWLEVKDDLILFAAADCTGHGVPGAMVSVICNNGLNRAVREHGIVEPGLILDKARDIVIEEFAKSDEYVQDGMDIALCTLQGNKVQYAGANNPLWLIRKGEIIELKGDRQPIGNYDNPEPFTTYDLELEKGDTLYIFTDGYADQFGGEKGKKLKSVNFKRLLLSMQSDSMEKQREFLDQSFEKWRGDLEQIDDVCVIGVRID